MKIAVFSTKPYDRQFLDAANAAEGHELQYFEAALGPESVALAAGHAGVCIFVNDVANAGVLEALRDGGTALVALDAPASTTSTWELQRAWASRWSAWWTTRPIRLQSMPLRCSWRSIARRIEPTTARETPISRSTG